MRNPGASLQQMLGYATDRIRNAGEELSAATQETIDTGKLYGPKSQALAMKIAEGYNPMGMTAKVTSYGMAHRPMTFEGGAARLHDLTTAFDDTIYGKAAVQNYGTGVPALDREAVRIFQQVKNKPDAMVTVYRAVPKDAKQTGMNPGDWISVSKQYAMEHGESALGGNYKIVAQKVPAKHLTTNADSILEQGYYP